MFGRVFRSLVCLGLIFLVSSQDADDPVITLLEKHTHRDEKAPSEGEINPNTTVPSTSPPIPENETLTSHGINETSTSSEEIATSSENSTIHGSTVVTELPVASGLTNFRSPLDCYSCLNCTVAHGNALTRKCASQDLRRPNLCIAYIIKYRGTDLRLRARGCTQELGTCRGIEQSLVAQRIIQIENCLECSGNLCNSSHALHAVIFNLMALVFTATIVETVVL